MNQSKKSPKKQLEKFSNVFTQLGLVLVLFIVYVTLEHKTEEKPIIAFEADDVERIYIPDDQDVIVRKKPKPVEPKVELPKPPKPTILENIQKGDDKIFETLFEEPKKNPPVVLNSGDIITMDDPIDDEPIVDNVPFLLIEDAPVFKGCEGLSKKENKICFAKKMNRFVQRNFDGYLAQELGLRSGKKRISTQFIIDKNGNIIDIQVRAPHPKLEKEAKRIIDKLPKFTPGKQRGNPVKVKYTLPITFSVE